MTIYFRKKFLKELSKIPKGERSKIESVIFKELPEANSYLNWGG
jgi:mRNA-degrading endonuclease RelE of RelBE toxin-antitoxin system